MANFYIALLHYPVYNKNGQVVTTSVTNLDVHDIARAARTYGVKRFYIVTPIIAQQQLVGKILQHWQQGYGADYNPSREKAFQIAGIKSTLDEVVGEIAKEVRNLRLVATGASLTGRLSTFGELRSQFRESDDSYLLMFGTGWGMAQELLARADYLLESIKGVADYNHLSVRSAVSVVLDRLCGREADKL